MTSTLWIALGVAVVVVVGYLLVMRVFYRQGRELDQQIDYTKIKKLKDEDD
jgi:low affinity Fe/Cu permease